MTVEILPATEAWVAEIEKWLEEEEATYKRAHHAWEVGDCEGEAPTRGFLCNWELVKRSWRGSDGRVDVLVKDGKSIGFLWGADILEIKPEERGFGYGRVLAQFMIELAYGEGRSVIEIEIAPSSALPFWQSMGFTVVPDRNDSGGGCYAYKAFARRLTLSGGRRVSHLVEFFTEQARHTNLPPFLKYAGSSESMPDGSVQLPERAFCFDPRGGNTEDCFVRLSLDSEVVFFDKLKRDRARAIGFQRDSGDIYFLECIPPRQVAV